MGQDLLWQRYFANNGSFTFCYPITEAEQLWTLRDLVLLLPGFVGNHHPDGWRPICRQLRHGAPALGWRAREGKSCSPSRSGARERCLLGPLPGTGRTAGAGRDLCDPLQDTRGDVRSVIGFSWRR